MINDKTITQLTTWPAFQSNAKQLARELNVSRPDASHELLIELLDHRLATMTDEDIQQAITADDIQLKSKLKFARKDIARRCRHQANIETEKAQRLSPSVHDDFIHLDPAQRSDDDLQRVIELLPSLFTNSQTRAWVASVLSAGKEQTMEDFNQSDKQFIAKLRKVVSYCHSHPVRTQGLMASRQDSRLIKELILLREFTQLVEDGKDDSELASWIYDRRDTQVLNNLADTPAIAYQGWVLNDYEHSGQDRYTLVNRAYQRADEINKILADR
jgi:hypothetical protein